MKNSISYFAAPLVLFFGIQVSLSAQITATWKGGTPGRANDWTCATNWHEGRVPNEFSAVVIPDVSTSTFSYPAIDHDVEILSLICAPSARLKVHNNAQIIVLQTDMDKQSFPNDTFAQVGTRQSSAKNIRN